MSTQVWLVGDSHIHWAAHQALTRDEMQLGLERYGYEVVWKGRRGAKLADAIPLLQDFLTHPASGLPCIIVFHLGCNDLVATSKKQLHNLVKDLLAFCAQYLPHTTLVWSFILPQFSYSYVDWQSGMVQKLREVNRNARNLFYRVGGKAIAHVDIDRFNRGLYRDDMLHLSTLGLNVFINSLRGAMEYFQQFPAAIAFPPDWMRR